MGWLGKIVSAPLRVANLPVKLLEAAGDVLMDDPGAMREEVGMSEVLDDIADTLEQSVDPDGEEAD